MKQLLILVCLCAGCAHHPRVQNPFPGVYRVAVVPFGDKTNGDQGVDAQLVTELFISELQKVPTYEVVPLQEVIDVLGSNVIETNQPELAYALARAVHAQAVVLGDVTEYNAYYPPVLGLHCEMYAMVTGEPALVVEPIDNLSDPSTRPFPLLSDWWSNFLHRFKSCDGCTHCLNAAQTSPDPQAAPNGGSPEDPGVETVGYLQQSPRVDAVVSDPSIPVIEPWVIRHSRIFDGANGGFVRKLQDYYFFRDDDRGGEWVGHLDRMEDFQRFSCNRMVYEMLSAAGGEWTPLFGIEFPMPWEPWPWR